MKINNFEEVDPFKNIKTLEELNRFPLVKCVLRTRKHKDLFENFVFLILISKEGDEKTYVTYLQKKHDHSTEIVQYDPIDDWDKGAQMSIREDKL